MGSQDPLLVPLSHVAQHTQPGLWAGSRGRGGAAGLVLRGSEALGLLASWQLKPWGLRWFRQQLREGHHGFKLSHS